MARTKINVADTDGTIGGGGTGGTNLQVNSADLGTDALGVIAI